MDNITHSLTGALAAKLISHESSEENNRHKRTLFWLLVVSANVPDIDLALRWIFNYFYYVVEHRGITHSLLFAPVLALLPASAFFFFSRLKNFSLLWLIAYLGIILHICFDVITSFGTRLLAPLSSERYALDWMFIIDPWFTGILLLTMIVQQRMRQHARTVLRAGSILAVLYLFAEILSHTAATTRIERSIAQHGIVARKFSAIPQPLSIFRWNGLIQTDDGVRQAFFSVFDDSLYFTEYKNSQGTLVETVLARKEVSEYFTFARHPWIHAWQDGERRIVELRDFQFTIDKSLLRAFGREGTPQPFCLRYEFSGEGEIERVTFNEEAMPN